MNTHVLRRVPVLEVQTKYKLLFYFRKIKVVGSYLFIYLGLLTPRAKPEVNGPLLIEEVAHSWAL